MEKIDLESGKKLVPESAIPNSKDTEVKFIPPAPRNGDAKMDIDNLKSVFTGLGKEELMKYADDRFWVRLRWFLFILFWLIWVAMLIVAIGIIVLAPKCPEPRSSWETCPIYKIDARAKTNLKGVESKLDYIKSLGVCNILLTSVLSSSSPSENPDDNIKDFESIDLDAGTSQEFDALIKTAKDKDVKVVLTLVPSHSSNKHAFFQKSVSKEEPYSNYYVWKQRTGSEPLSNTEMEYGDPKWTWNNIREEYYMHHLSGNQPDFNFRNQSVVEYFKNVFMYWLGKGVSGFNLERVELIMKDGTSNNDASKITVAERFTIKAPELITILDNWKSVVSNYSGVLTVNGLSSKKGDWGKLNLQSQKLSETFSAADLAQVVNSYLVSPSSWPVWQFSCLKPEGCWKPEVKNGLQMVSILLPGTPIIKDGEVIKDATIKLANQNLAADGSDLLTNVVDSSPKIFKKLIEVRNSSAFIDGSNEVKVLKNVFVYTRIKSGSISYLVAFNPTVEKAEVNFSEMKNVPAEITVEAWSQPISELPTPLKTKLTSSNVTIVPGAALLCSFMPQN